MLSVSLSTRQTYRFMAERYGETSGRQPKRVGRHPLDSPGDFPDLVNKFCLDSVRWPQGQWTSLDNPDFI